MTRKKFKKIVLIKSEFTRNALTLTFGTGIAQAFPILFYPILSRLFTPAEFGLFATIASLTAVIGVIATGKYEFAILIADTKQEAVNLIGLVFLLSSLFSIISYFFLLLISEYLIQIFNTPDLKQWLYISSLNIIFISIYYCYNEWAVRNKYFLNLSINKILNSSSTTLGKFFFGIIKFPSNGLILGDLFGRLLTASGCIYRILEKDKDFFSYLSFSNLMVVAKKYLNFPKHVLPGYILNTLGGQFPVFFIGAYFTNSEVGYFSMTMNVLSVPSSIISSSIRDTFRQRAKNDYSETGNCLYIFQKTFITLAIATAIISIFIYFLIPELIELFLGENWINSGEYAQIMIPAIALAFISNSLNGVLYIAEKTKVILFFQLYYFSVSILSLFIGYMLFKSIHSILLTYMIGMSSVYLLEIYLSYKYSKK